MNATSEACNLRPPSRHGERRVAASAMVCKLAGCTTVRWGYRVAPGTAIGEHIGRGVNGGDDDTTRLSTGGSLATGTCCCCCCAQHSQTTFYKALLDYCSNVQLCLCIPPFPSRLTRLQALFRYRSANTAPACLEMSDPTAREGHALCVACCPRGCLWRPPDTRTQDGRCVVTGCRVLVLKALVAEEDVVTRRTQVPLGSLRTLLVGVGVPSQDSQTDQVRRAPDWQAQAKCLDRKSLYQSQRLRSSPVQLAAAFMFHATWKTRTKRRSATARDKNKLFVESRLNYSYNGTNTAKAKKRNA